MLLAQAQVTLGHQAWGTGGPGFKSPRSDQKKPLNINTCETCGGLATVNGNGPKSAENAESGAKIPGKSRESPAPFASVLCWRIKAVASRDGRSRGLPRTPGAARCFIVQ